MRVLYLCHEALPAASTYAEQSVATAAALARAGVEVEVRCAGSVGAAGAAAATVADLLRHYGIEPVAGLAVRAVPAPSWPWSGRLRHAALDVTLARLARAARPRPDVVYTRDVFTALVAARTVWPLPVVLDTYRADLATRRRFAPWRRACLSRLGGVIAHSELTRKAFAAAGVAEDRLLLAYNGVHERLLAPGPEKDEARKRLGLAPDLAIACYAGHLGPEKGTDSLLALARLLPDVRFLLVGADPGDVADAQAGDGSAAQAGALAANVRRVARVPPPEVMPWLKAADVLLIPPSKEPLTRFGRTVLPMKTFLYLAAGRPILAPDLPDLREVLRDDDNAVLVPPDEPAAAARALAALLADRGLGDRLAARARADAPRFTWRARGERIAAFLAGLGR